MYTNLYGAIWVKYPNVAYRIAGIFRGYKCSRKCLRKVFADLIFVELGLFAACMHAILNFAGLMFAVHANPRKPRTFYTLEIYPLYGI